MVCSARSHAQIKIRQAQDTLSQFASTEKILSFCPFWKLMIKLKWDFKTFSCCLQWFSFACGACRPPAFRLWLFVFIVFILFFFWQINHSRSDLHAMEKINSTHILANSHPPLWCTTTRCIYAHCIRHCAYILCGSKLACTRVAFVHVCKHKKAN